MEVPANDSRMLGNATLTMVTSRNARKAPSAATSSTVDDDSRLVPVGGGVVSVSSATT